MLPLRVFETAGDELLYHYCTPQTFLAICQGKTLRFSDLYSMNDAMEMYWGYGVWERVAGKLIDEVGKTFLDSIDTVIHASGANILHLAACFSTQGDVLSQWRAYTQDATGYCIGFRASNLCNLAARPLQVCYDPDAQEKELEEVIRVIHEVHISEEASQEGFIDTCVTLACDLASYKNPAFVEESEVRLLHTAVLAKSNNSRKIVPSGGIAFEKDVAPENIGFTMRGPVPVPHIDMSFIGPLGEQPIVEVILGPKNDALPSGVSVFLETLGLGGVEVKRSTASYR